MNEIGGLDAEVWRELAALAAAEGGERALLSRLLEVWCRAQAIPSAALYLRSERAFGRELVCGEQPFPRTLAEPWPAGMRVRPLPNALLVSRESSGEEIPQEEGSLVPLSALMAAGVRNLSQRHRLKQQDFEVNYRGVEIEALYDVGLAIASTLDFDRLGEEILLRAISLLDARRSALFLVAGGEFRLHRTVGGDACAALPANDPRLAAVLSGAGEVPAELLPGAEFLLAVPMAVEGELCGFLVVGDKESRQGVGPFRDGDRRTLALLANQAAIALETARLHREALEKERLEREMELAAEIQRRILPKGVPELAGFGLFGWNRPARHIGGDYFDFLPLAEGRLGIVVGDVSGKGVPAALLVSTLHSALRLLVDRFEVGPDLFARLNQHILDSSAPNKFITLLLAELDPGARRLSYLNAGHNPAVLVHADGGSARLAPGGLPIGLLPHSTYRPEALKIESGDLLCIYSDGITEAASPRDEEFGLERLTELLVARRCEPLSEIAAAIEKAVTAFGEQLPQADDQTLVLLRCEG